jgi:ABC-type branched-subunit amino acid transport system substrate-binding protein
LSGRYAVQGAQVRKGLELWARRFGETLVLEDDRSDPERAADLHGKLVARSCRFVLGPYGSDCTRAVAATGRGVVWNHGAAADDVQRLPGIVSIPSPASRYLVALGRAVGDLLPGASVALVTAAGAFARFAREGLEAAAQTLDLRIVARLGFRDAQARAMAARADAILACGPLEREVTLLRSLAGHRRDVLLGGVSPGLAGFPALLGDDPDGLLAPVQWHPALGGAPQLGPSSAEVTADARGCGEGELDYVGAQAYAAALIVANCLEQARAEGGSTDDDALSAARHLRTTTFFGAFELDPDSGLQRGHRLSVIRWRGDRQDLVLVDAA